MDSIYMTAKNSGFYFPLAEKLEMLAHELHFIDRDEAEELNGFALDIVDGYGVFRAYSFYPLFDD